ncbi:MAG: hypothetical protein K2F84_01665 [Bacteroidales bacterium]|nr:hypothetical protein [Bacteroidales bacterium]
MKLFLIILVLACAMLILGGVLVLSLGHRDRNGRRRTAPKPKPQPRPQPQRTALVVDDSTVSRRLAAEAPEAQTPPPAEPAPMANPLEALEVALKMGPAIMSMARIHAEDAEEAAAKQQQALLFLQGAEALCTLEYALKKWDAAKTAEKRAALLTEIKNCTASIDPEAVRSACKATFDAMYPAFSEKLLQMAPDMNETELRLCTFLALGQSTKDMALLTRRSIRTIETSIYHIRKKLAIPTEEKTSDFLKQYLF